MTAFNHLNPLLNIKKHRELDAETRLVQATRVLQDADKALQAVRKELETYATHCKVRERELYGKVFARNDVKRPEIEQMNYEIEGLRSDLKRHQESVDLAEHRRTEAAQSRDQARQSYQAAVRTREKYSYLTDMLSKELDGKREQTEESERDEVSLKLSGGQRGSAQDEINSEGSGE